MVPERDDGDGCVHIRRWKPNGPHRAEEKRERERFGEGEREPSESERDEREKRFV